MSCIQSTHNQAATREKASGVPRSLVLLMATTAGVGVASLYYSQPMLGVLGPEGSAMLQAANATGLDVAREAFVDRAYLPDGRLVPRGMPGAVLDDAEAIAERALRMVQDRYVVAIDGTRCIVRADSLCVHGDGPKAVAVVRAVRQRFDQEGISLAPFVK